MNMEYYLHLVAVYINYFLLGSGTVLYVREEKGINPTILALAWIKY